MVTFIRTIRSILFENFDFSNIFSNKPSKIGEKQYAHYTHNNMEIAPIIVQNKQKSVLFGCLVETVGTSSTHYIVILPTHFRQYVVLLSVLVTFLQLYIK